MTNEEYEKMVARVEEYDIAHRKLSEVRDLTWFIQKQPEQEIRIRIENMTSSSYRVISGGSEASEGLRRRVIETLIEDIAVYEAKLQAELDAL